MIIARSFRSVPVVIILFLLTAIPAPAQFVQQGDKLVGSDTAGFGFAGFSVDLSADGNTAIVGGPIDSASRGAAWFYTRSGGMWSQQGSKLVGTGVVGSSYQGWSVGLSGDGNTAIVGGPADNSARGAAWVFTRSGSVWNQQGSKLVGNDTVPPSFQGASVALSADGNTAIVGGSSDSASTGAAWIYTRSDTVWTQQGGKLVGTGAVGDAQQGLSVALSADGNTAIVGGYFDSSETGAAWVYTRNGGVWTQQGSKLVGSGAGDSARQGSGVALSADGNTALVGGYTDDSGKGAVWVYTRTDTVWTQQGSKLVASDTAGYPGLGFKVALSADGNTALVGGPADDSLRGAVWLFTRSGSVWTQHGSKIVGTGGVGAPVMGYSVGLSADGFTAIAGGPADGGNYGAAWVFAATTVTTNFGIHEKWNIVSVPLTMGDYTKTVLFPTATTDAYTFDGGYMSYDTLENGRGYWLKFASGDSISHEGVQRTEDTIAVAEGWNMVGSLSSSFSIANVSSIPGGIVTSDFYGYDGGYAPASMLEPGKGYWVKVSEGGQLVMSSIAAATPVNRIRIRDTGELPPPPPDGVSGAPGNILPVAYELKQNYPNPFNPVTSIGYALPVSGWVKIAVYNLLGQQVAVLADGYQEAGYRTVSFDAGALPSGVYTYRIATGSFNDVKRMMLIK